MAFMTCSLRSVGVYCGTPVFIQLDTREEAVAVYC